jgi:hypothetical protein
VVITEAKTITLEHPLCYPFCTEVLSDCRGEFQLDDMEDQLPDCNATLPGTAGETMEYPPASQPYHYTLPDNTTTAYKCFVPGDKGSTLFPSFLTTHDTRHTTHDPRPTTHTRPPTELSCMDRRRGSARQVSAALRGPER